MNGKTALRMVFLVGVLTLVLGAGQVLAQGTIAVSATVGRHCVVGAGSLEFGDYNPLAATDDLAQADFSVRCTRAATPARVGLSQGINFDGTTRRMASGTEFLAYGLFQDVGHSTPWTLTNDRAVDGTTMAQQTLTVYGVITAGQDKPGGLVFSDTVNIIVVF